MAGNAFSVPSMSAINADSHLIYCSSYWEQFMNQKIVEEPTPGCIPSGSDANLAVYTAPPATSQSFSNNGGTEYSTNIFPPALAVWTQPDPSSPPFQIAGPSTLAASPQHFSGPDGLEQHLDMTSTLRKRKSVRKTNCGQVASDKILECATKRRKSEGRFRCEAKNCGQTFTARHNLANHANSHEGWKPCRCDRCGKQLGTSTTLRRHLKKLHGV